MKMILKTSLMSPDIEFKMLHSDKFLIDIDSTSSESEDDHDYQSSIKMASEKPDVSPQVKLKMSQIV